MTYKSGMKLSAAGRRFIERLEGGVKRHACRSTHNARKLLIGIGHILDHVEQSDGVIRIGAESVRWIQGLTRGDAWNLFDQDLRPVEIEVNEVHGLNQRQYDAMVSFCFSIGASKFAQSTVKRRLMQQQQNLVPDLIKTWIHEDGETIYDLIRRRKAEARLFVEGDYGERQDWVEVGPESAPVGAQEAISGDSVHPPVG